MTTRKSLSLAIALATIAGGVAGAAALVPTTAGDEIVRLDQVPPTARATIESKLAGGTLVEIERTTDHGRVLFEVDVRTADGIVEFDVAETGEFVGYESDDDEAGNPNAADDDANTDVKGEDPEADDRVVEAALAKDSIVLVPTPLADGVRWSAIITNPYLPLSEVRWSEMRSEGEHVIREVLDRTQVIAGVECLVLAEQEYGVDEGQDVLAEISYNFYAQDDAGNVYYFGEEVDEYKDGQVVSHGGAWLVGRNAQEPCLFIPADTTVGTIYKPENSPPVASEWALIGSIEAEVEVPAGEFEDVLVVLETNEPDRWQERKYYARGVGLISGNREVNLVESRKAAPQPHP